MSEIERVMILKRKTEKNEVLDINLPQGHRS